MSWKERVLRIREGLDLTQRELAEIIGSTTIAISYWEIGRRKTPGRCYAIMLEALEQIVNRGFAERFISDIQMLDLVPATGHTYLFILEAAYG